MASSSEMLMLVSLSFIHFNISLLQMFAEYISLGQNQRAENIINNDSVHDITITVLINQPVG